MGELTRRGFLYSCVAAGSGALAATERVRALPSETLKFADPVSENPVVRLTSPANESHLPLGSNRATYRRGNSLIFAGTRDEKAGLFRLDSKSGEIRQFAEIDALDMRWFGLTPDDRNCLCWSGDKLITVSTGNGRSRDIYRAGDGWTRVPSLSISEDGLFAAVIEKKDETHRIRLITTVKGSATTVVESDTPLAEILIRPKRAGIAYRRGAEIWLANFDGKQNYKLRTVGDDPRAPQWTVDGRGVLYLANKPGTNRVEMREFTPDTNEEKMIAVTTQFSAFSRNGDGSVFVAASASKAAPHVLLLVRSVRRELVLCEHKAADPLRVAPMFSANSQRIFFETDRDGKAAIYSMIVDKLVEETEEEKEKPDAR